MLPGVHGDPTQPLHQSPVQTLQGSRTPRTVPPSSYPQHSICRESKPSLCFYYFLFIPQEEFIQSSFEQQDPGLFFSFFTGIEKTNRTSAGNIQAGLCHLSITQREGRSTNKTLKAAQLPPASPSRV